MGLLKSIRVLTFAWTDLMGWYFRARRAGHSTEFYASSIPMWASGLMRAAGVELQVEGLGKIGPGPYLVAPNHQGNWDVPAMLAVMPGRPRFVMKRELLGLPFIGPMAKGAGMIAINRTDRRQAIAVIEAILREIGPGEFVYMFPEGTRTLDGRLGKPKRGLFYFAANSGLPILPIAITGSFDRFPKDEFLKINSGPIKLQILDPLEVGPSVNSDLVGELQKRWEGAMRIALGEYSPANLDLGSPTEIIRVAEPS